jgi:hypothetical protein
MKLWLIKKYGSVVPIAHGCIKAILKIAVPNESNHSASVQYLRSVHRLLVNLSELEISKGRPVPKLQSYLGSNAFLSALIEALPLYIKNQLFKELLNEGIDDIDTVEGKHHVASIVRIIKLNFMRLELIVKSSPSIISQPQQVKPQNNNQQPKKMSKPDSNIHHQSSNVPNNQQLAVQAPNPPRSSGQNTSFPPVLTGGNATPLGNSNQYQPNNQQRQNQSAEPVQRRQVGLPYQEPQWTQHHRVRGFLEPVSPRPQVGVQVCQLFHLPGQKQQVPRQLQENPGSPSRSDLYRLC